MAIEGDAGSFKTSWNFKRPEPDLLLATLTICAPQPAKPPALEVRWDFPALNLAGAWVSDSWVIPFSDEPILGFAIAGKDGRFQPAKAEWLDKNAGKPGNPNLPVCE